jgi:hypothetical protein
MFDLEEKIVEWRKQMLAAGIKSPVPLEELDSHLREEIEQQKKSGLSEAETFDAAVRKIGQAHVVQSEFRKVEESKKVRIAKVVDIIILATTSLAALFMGSFFLFKIRDYSELTSGQQISGVAACATFALLVWGGRLSHRRFPAIHARQIRDAIYIFSGLLITFWFLVCFKIILPRQDFAMPQLLVAILWGLLLPTGAGMGFELGNRRNALTGAAPHA